jgi:hypothetical protein
VSSPARCAAFAAATEVAESVSFTGDVNST